jgi:GT2 family glycosyltransferase
MINLANVSETIGLVGPMSNYAAWPQLVENVPYRVGAAGGSTWQPWVLGGALVDVSAVNEYAKEFRQQHRTKWVEAERLGGFCLLIKRQVLKIINQTSSLRDVSDLGLFDTDVSMKARQAGFKLACARDLFIHHFGSRIFAHGALGDLGVKTELD